MARLHTLSNGCRIIADPIDGFETFALSVTIGRGARWERKGQSGWAHLMEHMVFKGAGGRSSSDIVEVVEAAGGHINASTGYERTSFQIRALKGDLPLAVGVIADLIRRPTLDPAELGREKGVIAQEIAEAADTPDDLVFDIAQAAAFGDTALGRPILGTVKSVGGADAGALAAFAGGLYAPDAIVVSAAGAIDEDELLTQAQAAFGDAGAPLGALSHDAGAFVGGETVKKKAGLEQANLVFMLPACSARHPDYFASRLFAEALGGGMSSRLFQEVREKLGLAYTIDAFLETYTDVGLLGVYAGSAAKDAAQAARVSAEQIRALTEAPREGELARAKAQMKGSLFMARESALARAEQAAGQTLLFDRLLPTKELAERIDAVTVDDLRRVGERALGAGVSARVVLGAAGAAGATAAFAEGLAG